MSNMVTVENVSKSYGQKKVLNDIDISIGAGKIVGLIGHNGAGKTTLLKALLGLTTYDGKINVLNHDPSKNRAHLMQKVSYIADVAVLPKWFRVNNLLQFLTGIHPNFSEDKALHYIQKTSIALTSKVRELSKGMIVQLHLAIIMAIDAKLLVLDEPTLGLDILFRKEFYHNLLNDYFDEGKSIIITTHQLEEVEHILTDVIFLKNGHKILDRTMDQVEKSFLEVDVEKEQVELAKNLNPIYEKSILGKHTMIFESADHDQLSQLGAIKNPSLSDIFVALMQKKTS